VCFVVVVVFGGGGGGGGGGGVFCVWHNRYSFNLNLNCKSVGFKTGKFLSPFYLRAQIYQFVFHFIGESERLNGVNTLSIRGARSVIIINMFTKVLLHIQLYKFSDTFRISCETHIKSFINIRLFFRTLLRDV
jgi:hypothetical protein